MDLKELMDRQKAFDDAHGWSATDASPSEVLAAVSDDLVGLLGEAGELANIVKKLRMRETLGSVDSEFEGKRPELAEEVVDTLIYLLRIATHLGVDVEGEYEKKMELNRKRFAEFEVSE